MKSRPTSGAAPLSEGQRLVARRRGRTTRWVKAHPVATNGILAGLNLLLQGMFSIVMAIPRDWPSAPHLLVLIVFNLLSTALIFVRKRWPLQLLLGATLVDLIYSVIVGTESSFSLAGFVPWIFLYTVAAELSLRLTIFGFLAVSAANMVLMGFLYLSEPIPTGDGSTISLQENPLPLLTLLGFSVGMGVAINLVVVMFGRFTHKNNEFDREIVERFDQTQVLAATEERTRIAREMHDVVAHSLTVMITLADGARIVGKKNPERAEEVLQELSHTGRTALADMRRTLGVLREPHAQNAPLSPAEGTSMDARENLQELVDSFEATGMPVVFEYRGEAIPTDNNLRLSLYRIVQESLTNALRYGRNVSEVRVKVEVMLPDVWITVINDGTAALEDSSGIGSLGSGKGLTGIRERAAFYNGSVIAGPNDMGGWTLRAHLVWESSVPSTHH
ncbi:sensor histidine kinase [Rothia amarae]|uniref:histidine kinase n=1 Tax=Rothia amarae TaxID=169480 RepID=A0A7H2BJP5_9MICC|nr:histidine kinase [Rothia amarae]QNV39891.1 sensor histidine kinase [Rothia amarae]